MDGRQPPVSYTHLDVYKRQSLLCAEYERDGAEEPLGTGKDAAVCHLLRWTDCDPLSEGRGLPGLEGISGTGRVWRQRDVV